MKLLVLTAILFVAKAQAGIFEEALSMLSPAEREFAESLQNIFKLISVGKDENNDVQAGKTIEENFVLQQNLFV